MTPHKNTKEVELFWHISQGLVSKNYLQETLQMIVTMTANVMGAKICSVMLLDEKKGELALAATQSLSPNYRNKPPLKVGESISGRVIKEKKLIFVPDVSKDKTYRFPEIAKAEGVVSMLSIPLLVGDRAIGVINSYTGQRHDYSRTDLKTFQSVANQAAIAIENAMLRQENLSNRQALEDRKVVQQAKALLMKHDGLKEADAYRKLQKTSRDKRKSMAEIANAIIVLYSMQEK